MLVSTKMRLRPLGNHILTGEACYGKKTVFVFDKPGVGYNCLGIPMKDGKNRLDVCAELSESWFSLVCCLLKLTIFLQ